MTSFSYHEMKSDHQSSVLTLGSLEFGGVTLTGFPTLGTLVTGGVTFGVLVLGGTLETGAVTFVGSTLGMALVCGACTLVAVTLEIAAGSTELGACKASWLENGVLDGVVAGVKFCVLDGVPVVTLRDVAFVVAFVLETLNALTPTLGLETATGQSLKVAGGARRFGEAELEVFNRMRRILHTKPGIGLEIACQRALGAGIGTDDDGSVSAEALRELLVSLARASAALEALIAQTRDFSTARDRLERTIDDCGTEVMEIGARMRDWPGQVQEFRVTLKNLTELDGRIHARLQEVNALLDKHFARTLEKAVPIWIVCGIGAYLVGFVILPGLFALLGWRR